MSDSLDAPSSSPPPPSSDDFTNPSPSIYDEASARAVIESAYPLADLTDIKCYPINPLTASLIVTHQYDIDALKTDFLKGGLQQHDNPRRKRGNKYDSAFYIYDPHNEPIKHSVVGKLEASEETDGYFALRRSGEPGNSISKEEIRKLHARVELSSLKPNKFIPCSSTKQSVMTFTAMHKLQSKMERNFNKGVEVPRIIKSSILRNYSELITVGLVSKPFIGNPADLITPNNLAHDDEDSDSELDPNGLTISRSSINQDIQNRKRKRSAVRNDDETMGEIDLSSLALRDFPDPAGHYQHLADEMGAAFDGLKIDCPDIYDEEGQKISPLDYSEKLVHGALVYATVSYKIYNIDPNKNSPDVVLESLRLLPTTPDSFKLAYPVDCLNFKFQDDLAAEDEHEADDDLEDLPPPKHEQKKKVYEYKPQTLLSSKPQKHSSQGEFGVTKYKNPSEIEMGTIRRKVWAQDNFLTGY
ncbi:hypothetical protein K435DRAFT_802426 [Dendrothele bispora CBS 962.96]|uniref:Uncharacterized protein n=1 Tax=Dendrothele bispora (strain CBS 962.96) TaxID=1314807 RepID=A0A4S8LKV5_DENBC|nr:hypothetical protein K435DRAFT_802426 [Dendrothele bispora CBS 962.96]